ncbi:heavy-metal-associated domain-containing protein [Arthrobacter agilis]|uniref:heavy-metal-associated domain-containing protein n=1 Tax=Arthrobacter agilis TaxID=37921 RepID=UPI000B3645A7|nr:heavy-metal-associated domain-containing protein [Arthrobacter agilis]OUM42193.1 heavy metal transporter [Arthrobacter agilis]PPB45537.1 copper chaperone [Arthrobacter agilis]TPV26487.1 heavy-metal-associated domain-containing protein [Arthrobacter agilis]WDF33226.1 heavy-metal-associated domain-containing protein [Arthrobacter agilis]VDR33607.1 Copper chaperone CopZ [Arthrobacter agilis]
MTTTTIAITGMTCGHCVSAVTEELSDLAGVQNVDVDLVKGGTSTATISSSTPLDAASIDAAVAEAGYTVVPAGA